MDRDADVIIIGGGPAGSALAALLARNGYRALLLERDIHPRDHVGEALTLSTTVVLDRIGFLDRMNEEGFLRRDGSCWTSARAPLGTFFAVRFSEFPPPYGVQRWTYNVERDVLDTLLLRHAHDQGAKVMQGVNVKEVLFDGDRAVGVKASVVDGWEQDLHAPIVVDASGRRCMLGRQLGLRKKDPNYNQFAIYSWFENVEPTPGLDTYTVGHFLDLPKSWGWQIPLRDGRCSVGIVADKAYFTKAGRSHEEFFASMVNRNRNMRWRMRNAERIRPWWIEGDYSYKLDTLHGKGWLLIGDALRFVDPVFSTGVDVALFSSSHAYDAIERAMNGEDEEVAFKEFDRAVTEGIDAWYDVISVFYEIPILFTRRAGGREFREDFIRLLQGNLYDPETLPRAKRIIESMRVGKEFALANENSLLRPGAITPIHSDPAEDPLPEETHEIRIGYAGPGQVIVRS